MTASIEQPNPASGLGYWPAFWTLGSPMRAGGTWPTSGEIDIMEDVNALNEASQTYMTQRKHGHALIACPDTSSTARPATTPTRRSSTGPTPARKLCSS